MKALFIFVVCFLLGGLPSAACTKIILSEAVEVLTAQPSARNVRINVDLNGTRVAGAKLAVYSGDERILFTTTADAFGIAHLRKLPSGQYHIVATGEGKLRSDLVLAVSKKAGASASVFKMDLLIKPEPPPTDEYTLLAVEKMPVSERLIEFKGRVEDPLGAAISGAVVKIFPDGFRDKRRTVEVKTRAGGSFSEILPDGIYRALAMSPGFRTTFVVFEISRSAMAKDLLISLQIGGCS